MIAIADQLWAMSDAELNAFPLGIVRLDKHGTIHLFNAAEENSCANAPPMRSV